MARNSTYEVTKQSIRVIKCAYIFIFVYCISQTTRYQQNLHDKLYKPCQFECAPLTSPDTSRILGSNLTSLIYPREALERPIILVLMTSSMTYGMSIGWIPVLQGWWQVQFYYHATCGPMEQITYRSMAKTMDNFQEMEHSIYDCHIVRWFIPSSGLHPNFASWLQSVALPICRV